MAVAFHVTRCDHGAGKHSSVIVDVRGGEHEVKTALDALQAAMRGAGVRGVIRPYPSRLMAGEVGADVHQLGARIARWCRAAGHEVTIGDW